MIRIRQINVAIDEDEKELITKCAKKLKTNKENIEEYNYFFEKVLPESPMAGSYCGWQLGYVIKYYAEKFDQMMKERFPGKELTETEFGICYDPLIIPASFRQIFYCPLSASPHYRPFHVHHPHTHQDGHLLFPDLQREHVPHEPLLFLSGFPESAPALPCSFPHRT